MNKFKEIWKHKAHQKDISKEDAFAYCLIRAAAAKVENKSEVAKLLVTRAFKPASYPKKYHRVDGALRAAIQQTRWNFTLRKQIFGMDYSEIADNDTLLTFSGLLQEF